MPIPHTAIIPSQKERLGRALGRFVATHVFTGDEVAGVLRRLDLPGILHRFLADPSSAHPAALALAGMLPRLLATVEDGRARRLMARHRAAAGGRPRRRPGGGAGVAQPGGGRPPPGGVRLRAGRVQGRCWPSSEEALRAAIEERVREQGGRLVGWALGASIARRVLATVNAELDKMSPDGSELRAAFDEWVRREIARMEEDPARAAEIGAAIRRVVAHETVQAWLWDVWSRLRLALEADAGTPTGRTVAYRGGALANLGAHAGGRSGGAGPGADCGRGHGRERCCRPRRCSWPTSSPRWSANWDAATITDKLELRVGKDLQYVRVNGTLVGFLVGGLAYAVLRATFGYSF